MRPGCNIHRTLYVMSTKNEYIDHNRGSGLRLFADLIILSWWQQTKQDIQDVFILSHILQLLLGYPDDILRLDVACMLTCEQAGTC